jgi:1-acyl-sn-glycerol-3-phosphate acyltransferase
MYPHTSNWDFIVGVLARHALGLRARWVGKDTLFRFPFGPLMRWLGGMPVDRSQRTGLTSQLAAEMQRHPALCLALAPEGTRSRTPHLRSGFYHLAVAAGVPVGLGFFDYGRRIIGITRWATMTGDVERDLATLREFYADKRGKFPEKASPLTFGRP